MPSSSSSAGVKKAQDFLQKYRVFIVCLLFLLAIAGSSRFLRGALLPGQNLPGQAGETELPSLRTCGSEGTMFEGIENLDKLRKEYRDQMSAVVAERENILRTPTLWKCGRGGEPASPKLKSLAELLPGWHERVKVPFLLGSITVPVARPVTFDSFSSVLGELQREYECTLTELQDRTIAEVVRNQDIPATAQFCCVTDATLEGGLGCREQTSATFCQTAVTNSPTCDNQCAISITVDELAARAPRYHNDLRQERITSRVAMERTLQTMRSFDVNYAVARQLVCYERASLDLKQEMSLIADAISCMPKIWDAITSLHDTL